MRAQTSRQHLRLLRTPAEARPAEISFCSHCGSQPSGELATRVCEDCGLGLLLQTQADAAPQRGAPFIVVDATLSICAVSNAAEKLLATLEIDAVNRHVTELLVPADAEAQDGVSLAAAITWAARGDDVAHAVTVRPANTFGVRLHACIAACGPPRAALVVFN